MNFSVPEVNFPAGVRRESKDIASPVISRHVQVVLTSSEWVTLVGLGYVAWGVEFSPDGGTTWDLLVGTINQFGDLGKGVYMPSIGFTMGGTGIPAGLVRLFATATAAIRLGCQGTVAAEI
jgi:hypothetical protein